MDVAAPRPGVFMKGRMNGVGGAALEPVEEQVSEQERREMVDGEGAPEPVSGDVPGVPVPPALLTSTSIRERLCSTSPASRCTCDREDRSATNTSTCPPPAARISRAAPWVRPRSVRCDQLHRPQRVDRQA